MSDQERLRAIAEREQQATKGPWHPFVMTHEDRGDLLTPDECGEYVANSVRKSAEASGTNEFVFISVEKPDGPADVCHVGNGPSRAANGAFIAHAREDVPYLLSLVAQQAQEIADWRGRFVTSERFRTEDGHKHINERLQLESQLSRQAQEIQDLRTERDELQRSVEHTRKWWGSRFETLADWFRAAGKDLPIAVQFWNIYANGQAGPHDPPRWAQQFNVMKHRAESAESSRDALREALKKAKAALNAVEWSSNLGVWSPTCYWCGGYQRTPAMDQDYYGSAGHKPDCSRKVALDAIALAETPTEDR